MSIDREEFEKFFKAESEKGNIGFLPIILERFDSVCDQYEHNYAEGCYDAWDIMRKREAELLVENKYLIAREKALLAEIERKDAALDQIEQWTNAYPLEIFPEPDFKKAHELLKAGGMTLDAISASNMRHVISGVKRIINKASPQPSQEKGNETL